MGYREKVVSVARSQLGVCEPSGDDKYLKWFNQATNSKLTMDMAWCVCFVSWCLRQAGVPTAVFGTCAQCSVAFNWAKNKKIWYSRITGHRPKSGELILFDWDGDGKADHIGIVASSTVNNVTTIEGNAKGGATVDGVREKVYSATSRYIKGYIDIQYPDEDNATTTVVDTTSSVKDVQSYLVKTYGRKINVDGIWGPKSKKAMIECVQTETNALTGSKLVIDGIWGAKSKSSFPVFSLSSKGKMVYLIQGCLIAKGFNIEFDGVFGNETLSAVKSFQKKSYITQDGIVGMATMTMLLA